MVFPMWTEITLKSSVGKDDFVCDFLMVSGGQKSHPNRPSFVEILQHYENPTQITPNLVSTGTSSGNW